MPAYNFQSRFADAVADGRKTQTIRAPRKDGRIPKVGQTAYLYTGMRSSAARKLGEGMIVEVHNISIFHHIGIVVETEGQTVLLQKTETLNAFAKSDGFLNWQEMVDWFSATHGLPFVGHLIMWVLQGQKAGGRDETHNKT
jgi:hypothetical protein